MFCNIESRFKRAARQNDFLFLPPLLSFSSLKPNESHVRFLSFGILAHFSQILASNYMLEMIYIDETVADSHTLVFGNKVSRSNFNPNLHRKTAPRLLSFFFASVPIAS
jgi:hypothetical protein